MKKTQKTVILEKPKGPIKYVVWDLETDGFVAPKNKILEIGCMVVREGSTEELRWVLDNKIEVPEHITAINGMTNKIIKKEGRDPKECLSKFLPILKSAKKHITHNGIRFDIPFLVNYSADIFGWTENQKKMVLNFLLSRSYDTAVWGKSNEVGMERHEDETYLQFADRVMNMRSRAKYNLGFMCDKVGIDRSNVVQHRALGDVFLTHELYKIARKKNYRSMCCNAEVYENEDNVEKCDLCGFSCVNNK
jgi:DNA polymerase III epsilon subunit-like protein